MRRRPVIPAMCAVILLVVGQLVAFAHHATERHVSCDEHGNAHEAIELAELLHDNCDHDHFIAVDGDGDAHEDCPIQRVLRQSTALPGGWLPVQLVATATGARVTPPAIALATSTLYLIAPKTSPPA
jgi:hypothetical protein